jgi:acyl-CoA synthetase (AMP-forming)/AMP-acid ligase II
MVFEGTRITYREVDDRINRFANALMDLGCKKGDRLAILSENTYKYMEVYLAAAKAGMSVTPLNFRLSDGELTHIVNQSESIVLVAGDGYEEQSVRLKGNLGAIKTWIALDNATDGYLFYEELLAESSNEDPRVEVDEDEMALLMYTGGTTGLPKGVMLSHRNLLTSMYQLIIAFELTRHDTTCLILPVFHLAFWPALCLLMVGGTSVIIRRPDLLEIMRAIQDEKCTHINAVPTIYGWMLNHPQLDDFDLSGLRLISYAGSPMPPEVLKKCIVKFGNIFAQGYGMTEALGGTILLPEEHVLEGKNAKRLASAGKECLISEVRIVDEDGVPVKSGEVGEIAIRGKHVMKGYWKNPEQTQKVIRNGWYHSGDMGYLDEDNYLFLVDRKADMIVTGGENVYPKETEDALYEHPGVQECAVVSAPDERWGERVQAVVVLKPGKKATEEELINHCKSKLAGYKCPKKVAFWEEIPKTPLGKILRKEVKAHFWEGEKRSIG